MNPGKDLHERGSGFGGDLWASVLTYASTEMKTIFGAPALCTGDMITTGLMVTTGQGDDVPDKWEICYCKNAIGFLALAMLSYILNYFLL